MIIALLLAIVAANFFLLLAVIAEVALFVRVRQGDFEEMLIAIEAEARATRQAIIGHATPEARDRYAVLERVRLEPSDGE